MPVQSVPEAKPAAPSLERVYREHAAFVWRMLRWLGVEEASRDDVFHEVFLIVHRRLADYDGRASMSTWLFGITRNVVLHHRRWFARNLRRLEAAPVPQAGPEPDEHVAQLEARALVDRFLERLSEDQKLLFVLAEIEGLRVPEIAEQLGFNINTLYSRLQVLRRQFARFLAGASRPGARGSHGSSRP